MALDLKQNTKTIPQKCAPCCHSTKQYYHGVAAVITPSYNDGITHPWINVEYNSFNTSRQSTTLGYSLNTFTLIQQSISADEKTRTYFSNVFIDVPNDQPGYTGGTNASRDNSNADNCIIYLKLIVTKNISIDVFLSFDNVNWEKQNESFLGEYLSFVVEGDIKKYSLGSSEPISYRTAKLRITINTGNIYYYPADRFFLYNGAGCYDRLYKEKITLIPYTYYSYNIADNENLCCTENKYMTYFAYGEVYGKIGASQLSATVQQSFNTAHTDSISGPISESVSPILDGPIVSPNFSWVPKNGFPNVFIVKDDGTIITQTSALIDFREPVTYVSKPYYFKAQVNFWDIVIQGNSGGLEFVANAELTITE